MLVPTLFAICSCRIEFAQPPPAAAVSSVPTRCPPCSSALDALLKMYSRRDACTPCWSCAICRSRMTSTAPTRAIDAYLREYEDSANTKVRASRIVAMDISTLFHGDEKMPALSIGIAVRTRVLVVKDIGFRGVIRPYLLGPSAGARAPFATFAALFFSSSAPFKL